MFSFADTFGIKEPFPANIYPIEGTETKVTCVAFDTSGDKTAERVQFMRKDNFARYTNITESENVKFTQTTEDLKPPASELFLFGHSQTYRHVHVHVCVCSVAMVQDMTRPPPPLVPGWRYEFACTSES